MAPGSIMDSVLTLNKTLFTIVYTSIELILVKAVDKLLKLLLVLSDMVFYIDMVYPVKMKYTEA